MVDLLRLLWCVARRTQKLFAAVRVRLDFEARVICLTVHGYFEGCLFLYALFQVNVVGYTFYTCLYSFVLTITNLLSMILAIELNPDYVRAILRRAELYEKTDKLDEALEDYKSVLEKDPGLPQAREACMVRVLHLSL